MAAKVRVLAALFALVVSVIVVWHSPVAAAPDYRVDLRATGAPLPATSIKSPVIETVNPKPFVPCEEIPLDVIQRLGLAFTPPEPEGGLRCHYDGGNYQIAVEPFVWRAYDESLPADAVELDIAGHRAAQYWVMKPTDWNNRWWITCMVTFKTSYGVIQQSLYYAPIYSEPDTDCIQTNLQRARELAPYYKY
jgi:hypothetical protein